MDSLTKSWVRNTADEKAVAAGMKFDLTRAAWPCWWIGRYCRLYEGSHAGEPLVLRGAHSQPLFASQEPCTRRPPPTPTPPANPPPATWHATWPRSAAACGRNDSDKKGKWRKGKWQKDQRNNRLRRSLLLWHPISRFIFDGARQE